MSLWKEYLRPKTLSEAQQALASAPGPVLPVAGGTDLLIDLEQGRHAPVHTLVDLTGVAELLALELRGDRLFVGAAVPVTHIVESPLVVEHARALVEACALIGGPQVRNTATLGGNVAHALPAADGTVALMVLETEAEVASANGSRRVPLQDLFRGPGQSALEPGRDLLAGFYVPLQRAHQGSAFRRIMRPQGIALPILNVAAWLARDGDRIGAARIAVGPAAPIPWRAREAEAVLQGREMNEESVALGLEAVLEHAGFRTSPYRASADYRIRLVGVLLNEALEAAWERANE